MLTKIIPKNERITTYIDIHQIDEYEDEIIDYVFNFSVIQADEGALNMKNVNNRLLKKDSLLIIETGEYSDSSWIGPVKMLVDKTKQELADEFKSEFVFDPDINCVGEGPSPYDFLPWLIKKRYAENYDNINSWHIGSYNSFNPF